jgi:hypothetical protein
LGNAGGELRAIAEGLRTPAGAVDVLAGLTPLGTPVQVGTQLARDPNAGLGSAMARTAMPLDLVEQSPGWSSAVSNAVGQLADLLTASRELGTPGGWKNVSRRSRERLGKMVGGIGKGFYDAPVASTLGMVAPALHMASAHTPVANVADDAGMVAHHGTPHTFAPTEKNPLGEFDLSKMGSGEGAQAYGWGNYLAEDPNVARKYRDKLSGQYMLPNGREIQRLDVWNHVSHKIMAAVPGLPDEVIDFITNDVMTQHDLQGELKQPRLDETNARRILWLDKDVSRDNILDAYVAADIARGRISKKQGNIYHVDVPDEHVANFLDWDADANKQPTAVTSAYDELFGPTGRAGYSKWDRRRWSGEGMYREISEKLGSDKAASEYLASKGVFGLKFLDHNSRGAGQGTRNLVIFDPSVATITARK